jgi:hypothetical protein
MKKYFLLLVILLIISAPALCKIYSYSFPKAPAAWGNPISFNQLSPGFFQVMYSDAKGIIRIATYGISGGSMDTLSNPQLLMVFAFDKQPTQLGQLINE